MVERTFAWLSRSRRLVRDDERLPEMSLAMIHTSMSRIMLSRMRGLALRYHGSSALQLTPMKAVTDSLDVARSTIVECVKGIRAERGSAGSGR